MEPFDTPLRAAALGLLLVAAVLLAASLYTGRSRWRGDALLLTVLALALVLLSSVLQ